jgi:hypothetical protein
VRLAIDLRDTGRDAWEVACAMASRGFPLDAASHRVIIVRLREEDIAEGIHERVAPALLLALWATPTAPADEPERRRRSSWLRGSLRVPGGAWVAPPRSARLRQA